MRFVRNVRVERSDEWLSETVAFSMFLQEIAQPVVEIEIIGAEYDCSVQKTSSRDQVL